MLLRKSDVIIAPGSGLCRLRVFGPCLLLADTVVILLGMSWSHGLSQDLLLAYFFTVFLITIGETVAQVAIGSALVAAVYGYWLWISGGTTAEAWVRLPFFFLIAVFYASLIEQLKCERRRREEAEDENQHLRLLLDLASMFSETHATREFVNGIGNFVEGSCPGLRCRMMSRRARRVERHAAFRCAARPRIRRALGDHRRTRCRRAELLCQMVVHAAAGALSAAEQSDAAVRRRSSQFLATVSHGSARPACDSRFTSTCSIHRSDSDARHPREHRGARARLPLRHLQPKSW
jgi:K+-sensing histidine kinase KdpD